MAELEEDLEKVKDLKAELVTLEERAIELRAGQSTDAMKSIRLGDFPIIVHYLY